MKRFIFATFSFVLGLVLSSTTTHAQAVFNSPAAMPTVTISNSTRTVCNMGTIDGCWTKSTSAQPGDTIAVHLFYHNTSSTAANATTLGINPQSSSATTGLTFQGVVASLSGPQEHDTATLSISSAQSVTYIAGSARWYPSATSGARSVDSSALFGTSGFNIGTINPGEQGVLVAFFKVGNNVVVPPVDSFCTINSFYATPTTVTSGGYTTLYWSTSGCDYVTIDGVNYPVNGSGSFGPIYASRNYELRAWKNSAVQTRTASVNVQQIQNPTYACNDGYDNDGDGKVDYPNDPGCISYNDSDEYNTVITITQPQAVTTVATINSTTSARLNGIAVPNYTGTSSAWFEWGRTGSLGTRTNTQSMTASGSTYYSDLVSGLTPGTVYYYRAVVQNPNGIAYGDIVRFQTQTPTTPQPPRVITQVVRQPVREVVVAQSAPSLLELRVENVYDRMCVNGDMEYTVSYRNISGQTLQNAVLRVIHPKELTFINASRGDYEVVDRALTIPLGELSAGESGSIVVRTRVNSEAVRGNVAVLTAQVVYTNPTSRAQEDAIAYSLITVSEDCPNLLGASAFGIGSFFPNTLLGWLILILIILALIVLGRQLYKKKVQ